MSIPTLSLSLLRADQGLISEIVLWNYSFEMVKFLDYAKNITKKAHSLQILRDSSSSPTDSTGHVIGKNEKALVMGHLTQKNRLTVEEDFY